VKGTTLGTNSIALFENGPGPILEPVGGDFQPFFETGHTGGDGHLIFVLNAYNLSGRRIRQAHVRFTVHKLMSGRNDHLY
jgi:hypothetical protein